MMALAPSCCACCRQSSSACWRVFSQSSVKMVMLPPTRVCNPAPIVPKIERDPVSIQFKRRGGHRLVHTGNLGTVQPYRTGVLPIGGRTVLGGEFRAGAPKQVLQVKEGDVDHESDDDHSAGRL